MNEIVARHEALRTVFRLVDGNPVQRIIGKHDSQFHLREHDLRECEKAAEEFDWLIAEEASTSFDLETGPPIRGRLIRKAEQSLGQLSVQKLQCGSRRIWSCPRMESVTQHSRKCS